LAFVWCDAFSPSGTSRSQTRRGAFSVSLSLLGGTVVMIGQRGSDPVPVLDGRVSSTPRPTSEPVAGLNRRITDVDLQLRFEPTNGY
jgi:hypothetical protein